MATTRSWRDRPFAGIHLLIWGWVLWGAFLPAHADDIVEKGFEYLREANMLDPEGARAQGIKFDRLVKEFYEKMADDGLAERITKTFAGDKIENGYRIGETEVWVQKQAPGNRNSVDIIVWDVRRDANGKVTSATGVGMDHHTVHPDSPKALSSHKEHWAEKRTTAEQWERALKARNNIDAKIEMNPDNSFYWSEAAEANKAEIDAFTKERGKEAKARLQREVGKTAFVGLGARALGTTVAVLGVTMAGLGVLDALGAFYRSPVVARTRTTLASGQYRDAWRYWQSKCVELQTNTEPCARLHEAVSNAGSILSGRIATDFPDGMRQLYCKWEADARRGAKSVHGVWQWDDAKNTLSLTRQGNALNGTLRTPTGDPRTVTGTVVADGSATLVELIPRNASDVPDKVWKTVLAKYKDPKNPTFLGGGMTVHYDAEKNVLAGSRKWFNVKYDRDTGEVDEDETDIQEYDVSAAPACSSTAR